MKIQKRKGSVSVQLMITVAIALVITSLLAVKGINNYKARLLEISYKNSIQKLETTVDTMTMANGSEDFFRTPMYSEFDTLKYSNTAARFLNEFVGTKKDCGDSNGDCFAKQYKDDKNKKYTPVYKGACALLRGGVSICITPQIKKTPISGIMDLNGTEGPNVFGKDLHTFQLRLRERNYDPNDEEIEAVKYVEQPR